MARFACPGQPIPIRRQMPRNPKHKVGFNDWVIRKPPTLGQDETRLSNSIAASIWDNVRSRANLEFQACHRDRAREPDTGQSLPRSVCSSLWYKRIVQHNPKCNPVQHSNQQLAGQALVDRRDATTACSFGKQLRPEPRTRSF